MQALTQDTLMQAIQDMQARLDKIEAAYVNDAAPVGVVLPYGPAATGLAWNWFKCDGQAIDRVTYAGLFYLVGTTYGVGDSVNTFNIPDLRGRVVVGEDLTSLRNNINNVRGQVAGEQLHTLTTAEMPSHQHATTYSNASGGSTGQDVIPPWNPFAAATGAVQATGGGGSHNTMQPYLNLVYIIKAA